MGILADVLSGSVTKPGGTKERGGTKPGFVTNPGGTINRGGFCKRCGKELPSAKGTGRPRQYCDDTCRQAGHRSKTGKSARAGTQRVKSEIPINARRGLPKTPALQGEQ